MKRKLLIVSAFIFSLASAQAQEVLDAYKYSQTELSGTARSMSLGGAMGAMGDDISAVKINPGGIGLYRKASEIVTTLNFQNVDTKTAMNDGDFKDSKFNVKFNNLAFVGSFDMGNDVAPYLNVGFSYNKIKNFDRKYNMQGSGFNHSLVNVMADRAQRYSESDLNLFPSFPNTNDYNMGAWDTDWLAVMGYNSWLTGGSDAGNIVPWIDTNPDMKRLSVREKGSVNSYDFNIGTEFSRMLSIGVTASITDINYSMSSMYSEDFFFTNNNVSRFNLENYLKTEGAGWQLGIGAIFQPIDEISLGVAYQSPTWYKMTDYALGMLHHDLTEFDLGAGYPKVEPSIVSYDGTDARYDYKLRTPDRWTFSAAGKIKSNNRHIATISVDYELTDYTKMKLDTRDRDYGDYDVMNDDLKRNFKLASTLRAGAEISITPQFLARVGYQWQQSPMETEMKEGKKEIGTAGSVTHYTLDDDTHYITWGLGYRFKNNFFTDLAFVYKTQKADLYHYAHSTKATMKNNTFQGAWSVGFRF